MFLKIMQCVIHESWETLEHAIQVKTSLNKYSVGLKALHPKIDVSSVINERINSGVI